MVPGVTMPKLIPIERDYTLIQEKFDTIIGPLPEKVGTPIKGIVLNPDVEIAELGEAHGQARTGACAGRPLVDTDLKAAEMILAVGVGVRLATRGTPKRTRTKMADAPVKARNSPSSGTNANRSR